MNMDKTVARNPKSDLISRVFRVNARLVSIARPTITVCSLIVFLIGTALLTSYGNRPGATGCVIENLTPVELSDIASLRGAGSLSKGQITILLFYHPHCPCTSATVRGLARLSTRFSTRPGVLAFAYCPQHESDKWTESPLTGILRGIPGSTILVDREGGFCNKFGVMTSGHVLVFGANHKLVFSGGITASRGHEGDCQASSQFLDRVNRKKESQVTTPVYGCPIVELSGGQS